MAAIVWEVGLTVASALMFAHAFPLVSLRAFAWVALTPLFVLIRQASWQRALTLTGLWSVLAAYLIGEWFPRAVSTYYQQPLIVGAGFFVGCVAIMAAPYYMAFAAAYRVLARRTSVVTPLLAAAAWVTAELGRGRLFTGTPVLIGNPWGLLGYTQVGGAPLVQIAAVTGIYGVSFVVAAVNAALAEVWLSIGGAVRTAVRGAGLAALPAIGALLYGVVALHAADRVASTVEPVPVAVVQGNLDLDSTWRSTFYGRNLDVYLELTAGAISHSQPRIVFWPEAAMSFFVDEEPQFRQAIAHVLALDGGELVAGGPHAIQDEGRRVYLNSIYLLSADGDVRARYDKQYLVPFAEYFPLAQVDFLRRRFERVRVFSPGAPTAPLPTAAGAAGIAICNEAMLPEVIGARIAEGAAYLVNPSNDSWLNDRTYSALQFDIVAMRAIEQRRFLVRASTSGPSAIVDPWGRVQVRSEALTRDVIFGTIRPLTVVSVYGHIGDTFALLCVGGVAAGLLHAAWWRRQRS